MSTSPTVMKGTNTYLLACKPHRCLKTTTPQYPPAGGEVYTGEESEGDGE